MWRRGDADDVETEREEDNWEMFLCAFTVPVGGVAAILVCDACQ